jgi:polyisoprenoid-binding protein YceI
MATIEVTDIPAADPVPRNRLRRHLLSEDFFHVERHPEARFRIGSVTPQHGRLFQVVGALTIRDRTERVTFYARGWTVTADRVEGTARFAVDRHDYGVSYVGSTIKDDLVDDQFSLEIDILARRP